MSVISEPKRALELFYSYAHEDETWRIRLETHLSNLQRQGFIASWHDRNISAGATWEHEIDIHLNTAEIILLLISPDYIASEYCYSIEMKRAMERHEGGEACVIPVILRPTDWKGTPFEQIQVLPYNTKPVSRWPNRDEALLDVVRGIRETIEELRTSSPARPSAIGTKQANARAKSLRLWNIPYPRNLYFTGREDILKRLHETLSSAKTTALAQWQAMSGLGGIGKTQIAVEYAYRHRDDYQSIFWVNAASRETIISSFLELAILLDLPQKYDSDQNIVITAVKRWFITHDLWLLIYDNTDDLRVTEEFLPNNDRGYLLLTTRDQRLGAFAESLIIDPMDVYEGTLLLLRRARLLQRDDPLEQANQEDRIQAENIVKEMGGLPLALDQAAAYIEGTQCGLVAYLERYKEQQATLLQRRGRAGDDHPLSVATTFSISFSQVQRVSPLAAYLLQAYAFLAPDSIPEEMIKEGAVKLGLQPATIKGDLFDESVSTLRSYSLINRNWKERTLSIHRLVQAVLRLNMDELTKKTWIERTVCTVNQAFPEVEYATWSQCRRVLPHALQCADYADKYALALPETARLLNQTGSYLENRAQYTEAESLLKRAVAIRELILQPSHEDIATSLNNLALLYDHTGKYDQSEPLYLQALAIREKVLGHEHPYTASTLNNLALLYEHMGKYKQAEPLYLRALAINQHVLGREHLDTATTLNNLATLYYNLENFQLAEQLYSEVVTLREQKLGRDHPDTASSLNNLASVYQRQGKYGKAERLLKRALAIREEVFGSDHPYTAHSLNSLGALYTSQGKYQEAEPLLKRALVIREEVLGLKHPYTATALNNIALLYYHQGKYEEAEPLLNKALAIREEVFGSEHIELIQTLKSLAAIYQSQSKFEEAESFLIRAVVIREKGLELELKPLKPENVQIYHKNVQIYHKQAPKKLKRKNKRHNR